MKYLFIILFGLFIANVSFAEDTTVEMLNKLDKRTMVFSQEIVRIDPGDTVFWKATNPGHNVQFISKNGVPAGVEKFKSKVGKDTEFTFTLPGIYAYWCVPHKTLGMIGFIIVGNDLSNLDSIKKVKFIGKSKKIAKGLIAEIEG
ncbi:MAG: Pseudoazurin [Alphaproteobacteria bacterium MarineAlpha5_Bin2]|jgi:pseudoazurin|nr:plastocyanin/azurin family copper-binding protein [Alphaproteobacteria bacterium]PPR52922.1 MAG: Pseudoazurin [Alphaproteobacteria bacterium MarineAlpha5_Bin2]PPR56398.1 MAG: Pseudoazurin [Alphaproteobacteria bacterium MarineAlpha5_Bin3]